jgi:hypothetical protein
MNLHPVTFATLAFVAGLTVLAFLFERILILAGLTRGNTIGLVIAVVILSSLQQMVIPGNSDLAFGLFVVILGPLAANRYDMTRTFQKGRRWWLSGIDSKDS